MGGVLPLAIPLAWLVVILLRTLPRRAGCARPPPASQIALGVAVAAMLTDVNLEFVAWKVRGYWVWYPQAAPGTAPGWPPCQNYVSWFVLSGALACAVAAELRVAHAPPRADAAHPRARVDERPFPARPRRPLGRGLNTLLKRRDAAARRRDVRNLRRAEQRRTNGGSVRPLFTSQRLFEYSVCLMNRTLPSTNR